MPSSKIDSPLIYQTDTNKSDHSRIVNCRGQAKTKTKPTEHENLQIKSPNAAAAGRDSHINMVSETRKRIERADLRREQFEIAEQRRRQLALEDRRARRVDQHLLERGDKYLRVDESPLSSPSKSSMPPVTHTNTNTGNKYLSNTRCQKYAGPFPKIKPPEKIALVAVQMQGEKVKVASRACSANPGLRKDIASPKQERIRAQTVGESRRRKAESAVYFEDFTPSLPNESRHSRNRADGAGQKVVLPMIVSAPIENRAPDRISAISEKEKWPSDSPLVPNGPWIDSSVLAKESFTRLGRERDSLRIFLADEAAAYLTQENELGLDAGHRQRSGMQVRGFQESGSMCPRLDGLQPWTEDATYGHYRGSEMQPSERARHWTGGQREHVPEVAEKAKTAVGQCRAGHEVKVKGPMKYGVGGPPRPVRPPIECCPIAEMEQRLWNQKPETGCGGTGRGAGAVRNNAGIFVEARSSAGARRFGWVEAADVTSTRRFRHEPYDDAAKGGAGNDEAAAGAPDAVAMGAIADGTQGRADAVAGRDFTDQPVVADQDWLAKRTSPVAGPRRAPRPVGPVAADGCRCGGGAESEEETGKGLSHPSGLARPMCDRTGADKGDSHRGRCNWQPGGLAEARALLHRAAAVMGEGDDAGDDVGGIDAAVTDDAEAHGCVGAVWAAGERGRGPKVRRGGMDLRPQAAPQVRHRTGGSEPAIQEFEARDAAWLARQAWPRTNGETERDSLLDPLLSAPCNEPHAGQRTRPAHLPSRSPAQAAGPAVREAGSGQCGAGEVVRSPHKGHVTCHGEACGATSSRAALTGYPAQAGPLAPASRPCSGSLGVCFSGPAREPSVPKQRGGGEDGGLGRIRRHVTRAVAQALLSVSVED